jgi:hypothetical protein
MHFEPHFISNLLVALPKLLNGQQPPHPRHHPSGTILLDLGPRIDNDGFRAAWFQLLTPLQWSSIFFFSPESIWLGRDHAIAAIGEVLLPPPILPLVLLLGD